MKHAQGGRVVGGGKFFLNFKDKREEIGMVWYGCNI